MTQRLEKYLQRACLAVLAYIPFHALLSTLVISNFGSELFWKVLKDLVVAVIAIGALALLYLKKPQLRRSEKHLFVAIAAFMVLCLGSFILVQNLKPALAGLIINSRFLLFFAATLIIARCADDREKFITTSVKVLLYSVLFVVFFGLLQVTLLPKDFLRHFGYSKELIPPYFTVDNNESIVRILSTLRGPNPLGAYLAVMLPIGIVYAAAKRIGIPGGVKTLSVMGIVTLIVLAKTYSRSALIGAIAGGLVLTLLVVPKLRKSIVFGVGALLLVGALFVGVFYNSLLVQRVVFHNDPLEGNSINSDQQHTDSLRAAVKESVRKPLGHGIGSAGLASTYSSRPFIVENYFIQVFYELGVLGLALMVTIHAFVARLLWRSRDNKYAAALLAGFLGMIIITMFWPAWSDETVSLVWWGFAGVVLGVNQVGKSPKRATVSGRKKI